MSTAPTPPPLAFVIGPFRGGPTLLRKVIDAHPRLYSPAETWHLLHLLRPLAPQHGDTLDRQCAAAIGGHVGRDAYLRCVRSFAETFYAEALASSSKPDAAWFVDKTPRYLEIAGLLPRLFPRAKMILLTRDPRAIAWSRYTWKHNDLHDLDAIANGVAADVRRQADFARTVGDRCLHVRYERLCADPETVAAEVCAYLGVEPHPAMASYGAVPHHEGYGDELTRAHARPHTDSVDRWNRPDPNGRAMSDEQAAGVLDAVGERALRTLGMGELIGAAA